MSSYLIVLATLAVIVLPVVIGAWLAKLWRMPDHGWKISLVLFATLAGAAITFFGWPPKLGIDLSGGTKLIYSVQPNNAIGETTVDMDKLISAVTRRVNPSGTSEVSIRPYGNDIEVIIPEADNRAEADRIEKKISSAGTLEFRILADTRDTRHDRARQLAEQNKTAVQILGPDGKRLAEWVPMSEHAAAQLGSDPNLLTRKNERGQTEVLVNIDQQNVNGDYLRRVAASHDETGNPSVDFEFNARGSRLFSRLTGENLPDPTNAEFKRHLGIILDGTLDSAPYIQSTISDRGTITGRFTQEEVDSLVDVLRAGQLPAKLSETPEQVQIIDATLGPDTIRRGALSMGASVLAVMLFMIFYYRFSGIVACVALILNILLTLAVMITIKAAFTLPGLAGLVLTVGMAVDANVLIYERIREELAKGATLRMAIRNGFSKAMSTIIDSNVTTILTAVVLYIIGTAEVKGFAVTLFVGLSLSLFTATFVARLIFDVAERQGWITQLKMRQFVGVTHFDFMRVAKPAIVASLVVIAIGMAAVFARGSNLLNIDFTGGTQVTMLFNEPQEIAEVRDLIDEHVAELPDATVNYVSFENEEQGKRIEINTSQLDQSKVQEALVQIFGDKLATQHVKASEVRAIEGVAPEIPATAPAKADEKQQSSATHPEQSLAAEMANYWQRRSAQRVSVALELAQANPATQTPAATTSPPAPSAPATPVVPPLDGALNLGQTPVTGAIESVFAGGTQAKLTFADATSYETLRDQLESLFANTPESGLRLELFNLQNDRRSSGQTTEWELKIAAPADAAQRGGQAERITQAVAKLDQQLASRPHFPSLVSFGAKVAGSTQEQAIYAMIASLLLIVVYIWLRFQKAIFGIAAVVALIHDVLVTLGALALSSYLAPSMGFLLVDPFKIDLPIIAAFLTLIGYSLNDTIVIFDRIREVRGKSPDITAEIVNLSVNQTLSRTILTALTVFMTVFILYIWGGQGIHGFAFALLIGCIAGTYSTVYIASPVLLWLYEWQKRRSAATSGAGVGRLQRAAS
ncbi:MAG: protein translocase subunit SecD [Pirellulales bacterium]|nr:protein translocase subunit SecD [Pirellulales bacterium]